MRARKAGGEVASQHRHLTGSCTSHLGGQKGTNERDLELPIHQCNLGRGRGNAEGEGSHRHGPKEKNGEGEFGSPGQKQYRGVWQDVGVKKSLEKSAHCQKSKKFISNRGSVRNFPGKKHLENYIFWQPIHPLCSCVYMHTHLREYKHRHVHSAQTMIWQQLTTRPHVPLTLVEKKLLGPPYPEEKMPPRAHTKTCPRGMVFPG